MEIVVDININKPIDLVFDTAVDIKNCANYISGINKIEILSDIQHGKGLMWKETRVLYGKEATEIMEISEFEKNKFYKVIAESHGSKYITLISFKETNEITNIAMKFIIEPQSFFAKIMNFLLGKMIKNSIIKCFKDDLNDIKNYCENR